MQKKILKYDGKLVFSNTSTHFCSNATQGMHHLIKENFNLMQQLCLTYELHGF